MKLKIGTVKKKETQKELTTTILNDYTDGLSDEELEEMSEEANEIEKEIEEIPKDIKKEAEEEAEIKEAVNDVFILDEVGIHTKSVKKYIELFPKRKIIYRGFITKIFLEWYIKKAKPTLLKKLYIKDSEFVNPKQQEGLLKKINKRLKEPSTDNAEDIEISDAELDGTTIELETEEQIEAYEFLLTEKWKKNERAKGIQQLDAILKEQMRVQKVDLTTALIYVIDGFQLQTKWIKTLENEEKDVVITEEPKKEQKKYIKAGELSESIKRFHDIKFLYNLMSEKMEFTGIPTKEDIAYIKQIKELLKGGSTPKKKKTNEPSDKMAMDKFLEGGKD